MAGTAAAVDYFAGIGASMSTAASAGTRAENVRTAMQGLFEYEATLASHLIAGLKAIPGVKIQGISDPEAIDRRVPTVSFTHRDHDSSFIAEELAKRNIFVWSGHNYAVEAAKTLGIFDNGGAVRVGPVHYNSTAELDVLLQAVNDL